MDGLTQVAIDFKTSHLLFPKLILIVLAGLGLAILARRWRDIAAAGAYWRGIVVDMDKPRFLGSLALTVAYFSLMVPVGDLWPNTGLGFLICSVPFVFLSGVLYMQERTPGSLAVMALIAALAPTLVWWVFVDLFYLTLP